MPKSIKKKPVDKKNVPQDDEVKSYALDALDAVKERQKQLITAAVAVAAILAVYMTFSMYSASVRADASAVEMKANNYYYGEITELSMSDGERLAKALELYKESVDKKASLSALYNLGNTYYKLGDYDNAVKQYEAVANKFSANSEMLPLVYQKMAASYVRMGKNDMAFEALGKLGALNGGIFKDTALVLEARYLENAGDAEKSLEKYLELASGYPDSIWSAEAASKLPSPEPEAEPEEKAEAAETEEAGKE